MSNISNTLRLEDALNAMDIGDDEMAIDNLKVLADSLDNGGPLPTMKPADLSILCRTMIEKLSRR